MKIAICSDEKHPIHDVVLEEIQNRGHDIILFGALKSGKDEPWVQTAKLASEAITSGDCAEGIFFCWTGTGISIAANKIAGIRAALCPDAQTAEGARIWNHANVLALSNQLMTPDLVLGILKAWFETSWDGRGNQAVAELKILENS